MKMSGYTLDPNCETSISMRSLQLFSNLLTVAGEWAGFDEEWLFDRATKRARRRNLILRAFVKIGIRKWLMTYATERHWDTLVRMLDTPT